MDSIPEIGTVVYRVQIDYGDDECLVIASVAIVGFAVDRVMNHHPVFSPHSVYLLASNGYACSLAQAFATHDEAKNAAAQEIEPYLVALRIELAKVEADAQRIADGGYSFIPLKPLGPPSPTPLQVHQRDVKCVCEEPLPFRDSSTGLCFQCGGFQNVVGREWLAL